MKGWNIKYVKSGYVYVRLRDENTYNVGVGVGYSYSTFMFLDQQWSTDTCMKGSDDQVTGTLVVTIAVQYPYPKHDNCRASQYKI